MALNSAGIQLGGVGIAAGIACVRLASDEAPCRCTAPRLLRKARGVLCVQQPPDCSCRRFDEARMVPLAFIFPPAHCTKI
jgi:hypothetical protein